MTTCQSAADRDDGSSTPQTPPAQVPSLAERQQAYEEARARIFARDYSDGVRGSPEDYERTTERERRVPVVAQRLIGRALGVATRGTRGGETQQTGQNGAGSSDTGQPGMTRSRKDMQTEERGPGEKAEGGLRNGEKVISSGGTGETPPAGLSGDGENRGQAGTSVARKTTGQANVGGKKERCGDAENGVHLSDGGRRKKESNRDFGKRELVLRSDKRQQRGLVEACEEAVIRSGGGSEPRKESAGKVTRVQPQSHRKRDRRRATKVRNGSQREQRASADELERGAILDMKTVRAKDMESGESAWRNGDPRVDEDGASNKNGLRSSDPERAKTTSFGVAGAERKVGRSPGQGAGARMFRMALPRGQVGQRDRTEKGVRSGELPEDETSAGERSCRESDGASCARDASEVENGGDILKASPSRRGESSMNDAAIDSAKLKLRVSQASELETSSPAENVESTVKRKGLPLVAGKMLSHALGLTQRGWSQVGRL